MTLARARTAALAAALACLAAGAAHAYPLDATDETGIPRLDAYDRANRGENLGKLVPLGAMLRMNKITLRLLDRPGFIGRERREPSGKERFQAQLLQQWARIPSPRFRTEAQQAIDRTKLREYGRW